VEKGNMAVVMKWVWPAWKARLRSELSKKHPTVNRCGWVSAVVPDVLGTRDDEVLVPLPKFSRPLPPCSSNGCRRFQSKNGVHYDKSGIGRHTTFVVWSRRALEDAGFGRRVGVSGKCGW